MRVAYNLHGNDAITFAEDFMTPSIREFACVTILAAALGAGAQPPSGAPPAPPGMATPPAPVDLQRKAGPDPHPQAEPMAPAGAAPGDPKATADAAYLSAQKTCDAKTGADKDTCLKDAKTAYDRTLGRKDSMEPVAPPNTAPTPSPKVPGAAAPGGAAPK